MVAPFTCPECSREGWRDRITLARHYAFAHNKLFEMTDVTPEMLNMSNMELKKSGRKQSDGDVANQNNHVKSKLEEEEDLEMKESVAAPSVKSESNFVQWQKSFGKHDAQSGKRKNREGESKEERRERKEKRRMERREAKRCEEEEEKRNRVKREGGVKNEKEVPAAKPLFSLMKQELGRSGTSVRIIKGEEAAGKVKEFLFVLSLFNSFY